MLPVLRKGCLSRAPRGVFGRCSMFTIFHRWKRARSLSNITPQALAGLMISLLSHSMCRATTSAAAVQAQCSYTLPLKECTSTSPSSSKICHTERLDYNQHSLKNTAALQSSTLLIWFVQDPPGKCYTQTIMTESQRNKLIRREKNNAISIYKESVKCDFSHLVPSSLPVSLQHTTFTSTAQKQSMGSQCVFSTPGYISNSCELADLFSECNKQ